MKTQLNLRLRTVLLIGVLLSLTALDAHAAPRKRALLIGIDDYTASHLPPSWRTKVEDRGLADLQGAVRDVETLRAMLMLVYGFNEQDIVVLENQNATRGAILQAIDRHLVKPSLKGDVAFFYFAGHGSQVPNSLSDEVDHLDESIVPADSRRGAPDIRDKELRASFNQILDRGAQLTLLLDHCHSGSSFRGLPTGARPRGIRRSSVDVRDAKAYGPRPDKRGALVFAATQDLDAAWEIPDRDGLKHGAFSWAFIQALRDAATGEAAQETFLRAQARLRAETPFQAPVMAGTAEARLRPFLATRIDRRGDRTVLAVESIKNDTIIVAGGWVNGLSIGSELRIVDDRDLVARLIITQVSTTRSEARMAGNRSIPQALHSGALVEVSGWAAPPTRPLRIWTPNSGRGVAEIAKLARGLFNEAQRRSVRWIPDPINVTPTHVLRPSGKVWELLDQNGSTVLNEAAITPAIARLQPGSSLFVQFPAPSGFASSIASDSEGVELVDSPQNADYILTGRYTNSRLEFAWVRPLVRNDDARQTGLPQRSAWTLVDSIDRTRREAAVTLREAVLKLRRIHAWNLLEPPPGPRAPYRLTLQRVATREVVKDGALIGGETYKIALTAAVPRVIENTPRYYYAFVIDSHGKSYLAFPSSESGSVENRFPIGEPPATIVLGDDAKFGVMEPYGVDTYFLLSTDEPLPNPSVLEWDGVRAPSWNAPLTPLEELFLLTSDPTRGRRTVVTSRWSLEKVVFESVAPRQRRR